MTQSSPGSQSESLFSQSVRLPQLGQIDSRFQARDEGRERSPLSLWTECGRSHWLVQRRSSASSSLRALSPLNSREEWSDARLDWDWLVWEREREKSDAQLRRELRNGGTDKERNLHEHVTERREEDSKKRKSEWKRREKKEHWWLLMKQSTGGQTFKSLERNERKGNSVSICQAVSDLRVRLQRVVELIKMDYQGQTNGFTVWVLFFFYFISCHLSISSFTYDGSDS